MGYLKAFQALEAESRSISELLGNNLGSLKQDQLDELFESEERKLKDALDDHYVSMRLIRGNISDHLSTAEEVLEKIEGRKKDEEKHLGVAQKQLAEKQNELQQAEKENADAKQNLEDVIEEFENVGKKSSGDNDPRTKEHPALNTNKKLLYCVTRITWDVTRRKAADPQNETPPTSLRGYVVDPRKQDVSVFDIDTSELNKVTACQYLWDYIGAVGISPKWKNV